MIGTETQKHNRHTMLSSNYCTVLSTLIGAMVLLTCSVAFAGISFNEAQFKFAVSSIPIFSSM